MNSSKWPVTKLEPVAFVSSPLLESCGVVRHGVTTRHGDLNLSFRTEPDAERVKRNRVCAAQAFGAQITDLVIPEQVHASGVAAVNKQDSGRGGEDPSTAIPDVDALVTNEPGLLLGITIADCLPVFLVDTERRAIGLAHSGWRGTAGGIAAKTLKLMIENYGTDPRNVLAAIGPGIQGSCYEVDERVWGGFPDEHRSAFQPTRPGHWRLDLRKAVFDQLVECGVSRSAIDVCPDCTHCRSDRYFSHRGEGPGAGRMGAFIRLS